MSKDFEIRATGMQDFITKVAEKQASGCRLVKGSGVKIGMKLLIARMEEGEESFETPLVGKTRKIQLPQMSQSFTTNVDNIVEAQDNGEFIVSGSYAPQAVYTGSVLVSTKQKEETSPTPEKESQEDTEPTPPAPKTKKKTGSKGVPKKQAQKQDSE